MSADKLCMSHQFSVASIGPLQFIFNKYLGLTIFTDGWMNRRDLQFLHHKNSQFSIDLLCGLTQWTSYKLNETCDTNAIFLPANFPRGILSSTGFDFASSDQAILPISVHTTVGFTAFTLICKVRFHK